MVKTLSELKGYNIVGKHSAVKTCLWLKKSLKDEGVCYKEKFYGIKSHRCLQISPALRCNLSCIHCWRPLSLMPEIDGWDDPQFIVEESIKAQQRLLSGFWGTKGVNTKKLEEAYKPNQVAISLIGEPTLYPFIAELVDEFNSREMTTFVVTNGTNPNAVDRLEPYQLYISLTAYSESSHKTLNKPHGNLWDKINRSLEIMSEKDCRTVLRLTLIKGINMNVERFAGLINKANPDFIEAKAYMHLGHSRYRLERSAMPEHDEIRDFAEKLEKLADYRIVDESEISRVVLLERK
ncbi:wyosine biosynthesis protein TYW1 [Archaeoglobus sulfaticallidus PM70-1]|uniref:S-adenosyl-L-methionine-dependent tRNA 4-demethylwyosine synthase n=2 Tax=Archaeoglobus TaxID=2233 RepID=N0BD55_9EURY|nr:wyosine biosynthesis protein TYW1 [Archaeoglobus sulfaticallidus PM70-1]